MTGSWGNSVFIVNATYLLLASRRRVCEDAPGYLQRPCSAYAHLCTPAHGVQPNIIVHLLQP